MIRYGGYSWAFAAVLSFIAGLIDATAFMKLNGFFVSFMSGNSTRLGVGLASHLSAARLAGSLVALFLAGVVIGALVAELSGRARQASILVLVSGLLACAAVAGQLDFSELGVAAMALAMGAVNNVFQKDDEVTIGLTYMTGTLVKAGQRIAAAIRGRNRWDWAPYLILWAALVGGALVGGALYDKLGLSSMWAASGVTAVLAVFAALSPRDMKK